MSNAIESTLSGKNKYAVSIKNVCKALSSIAERFGWAYVFSWLHRISGVILSVYFLFHIVTLSALDDPGKYAEKMEIFTSPFFLFLAWALSVPVIFHAVNGLRLLLYESFGVRKDHLLIRLCLVSVVLYSLFLGLVMISGSQNVTPMFYWGLFFLMAVVITYEFWNSVRSTRHSPFWIAQRITAAYLFVLVPAHMLFTHLNTAMAHDASVVTARMSSAFITFIDITLVLAIAYHAAYGLISISKDYIRSPGFYSKIVAAAVIGVMAWMALWGIKTACIVG
ncbi:hypothetical protein [Desulfovermiculus halophilus]|jgi:succinate dehydrogenase cytochrome b556 subunit|uniref:hypothetical protein n=1 Tax=Desulfovermiculus halophilus TaxID=339722 RepID=UPI0012947A32|nr:hypothetical protein [Desulfovermiculus halophilus]